MITDIPTKADFDNNGIAFLNLAWRSVISISLGLPNQPVEELGENATEDQLREAEEEDRRWTEEVERYWLVAQQELATAVALTQQGTEFLLKGRIAEVTPFLLLSGDPGGWPTGCERDDMSFAEFKTIDAQDLLRCHDTVCTPRLTIEFRERFEQLRRQRNSVMHTVDRRLRFTTRTCILAILEMAEALVGPHSWIGLRREQLQREPEFDPYSDDYRPCQMATEILYVVDLLQPAEVRRFFNFNKRQRRYLCPGCEFGCGNWEIGANLAQLQPNTPDSTSVFCIACGETYTVVRADCRNEGCPGNVISVDYENCMTCGRDSALDAPEVPPQGNDSSEEPPSVD